VVVFQVQNMSKQNQQAVMKLLGTKGCQSAKFHENAYLHIAMKRIHPNMLTRGVMVWYANSCPNVACTVQDTLHFTHQKVLNQPPYSPDWSLGDFHVAGPLKKALKGQ
jgi:hypothetical protein